MIRSNAVLASTDTAVCRSQMASVLTPFELRQVWRLGLIPSLNSYEANETYLSISQGALRDLEARLHFEVVHR
ncbi:hypothetical protein B5P44_18110 [Mycobacterium sp. CBMA 213]|nr:hypothetical protein [Mycolicibacterium sp. CBMA 213]